MRARRETGAGDDAGVGGVLSLTWQALDALRLLFAGRGFGPLLSTLADWTAARLHLRRGLALALVVCALGALLALVAWRAGPMTALRVALLYVAIQFVGGNVLDPILTRTVVAMPPALTFSAQVLLGVLVGPVGLAIATPLVAVLTVLVRRLHVEDVLGDRDEAGAPA